MPNNQVFATTPQSPYWFAPGATGVGATYFANWGCDGGCGGSDGQYNVVEAVFASAAEASAAGYTICDGRDMSHHNSYNCNPPNPSWGVGWLRCFYYGSRDLCDSYHRQGINHEAVYPSASKMSQIVPMSRTEDKGSSGSSDNAEAASGNAEFPPPKPRNIICLLSSLDLKSGNVYHSQQVGPLTFSYNSLDTTDGPLGIGWTHDFNMSITPDPDGSLFLKTGDGNRTWYGPNTSGVYYSDVKSGDSSSITANADGSYTRTTRYGKVYSFDASGKLAGITDRNGNATTLTYTGDDLTGIEYPGGRAVGITVEAGKIKTITDFLGKNWTVAYSTAGQIEYITDPLGNAWHFQYNSNNRMEHKTDPSGNTSTYVYDPATGKLTAAADPNNIQKSMVYNASTNTTTVTESDGGTWVHKYYPPFNVPLEITDPYGKKTIYAYNSGNQLLSITYPDQTSTIYAYDAGGNVATVTDRRGKTTTYSYNAQNRLTGIQDPAGNTAHITCDSSGNIATYQDPAGNVTTYSRDSRGNLTGIEDPLLHKTTLAYDAYNQLTSVTDA